jgi:hypothetical protein
VRGHDDQVDALFLGAVDDGTEWLAGIDELTYFQSDACIGDFLGDKVIEPRAVSLLLLLIDGIGLIQHHDIKNDELGADIFRQLTGVAYSCGRELGKVCRRKDLFEHTHNGSFCVVVPAAA